MLTVYHGAADEQRGIVTDNSYTDLLDLLPVGRPVFITPDGSTPDRYFLAITETQVKTNLKRDPKTGGDAIIRVYFLSR